MLSYHKFFGRLTIIFQSILFTGECRRMPPQNTIDQQKEPSTNGTTTPVDIPKLNLNNNVEKQGMLMEKFMIKEQEETPPTTSVVVPPDGGWGWVVMVRS
jgi:hypothetical protein